MKKNLACLMLLLLAVSFTAQAAPYKTYTYINGNDGVYDVNAPAAYTPGKILDSKALGVSLSKPEDIYKDYYGNFYISDTKANAVFVFTNEWKLKFTIRSFDNNGKADSLKGPQGVCVSNTDLLYVADTENSRILVFDLYGNFEKVLGKPRSPLLGDDFAYYPRKIAVDDAGRIFVVARNVFDGLLQLTLDGQFKGFIGSNYVTSNWYEEFWQSFMTEEQIKQRLSFVPVEYANIALDSSGFIYAVTAVSDVDDPIRCLNPSGDDVLIRNPLNGTGKVLGDLIIKKDTPSSFVDVAVGSDGIYYVLDHAYGRVFAYDEDGNMLFEFGGLDTYQKGTFLQPTSMEADGDTLYVLDSDAACIVQFEPTEYMRNIYTATQEYRKGNYEESLNSWELVLKNNSNCDLAYAKAGFCLYRMGEYKKAMDYFIMANDRDSYSMAMVKYRKEWMSEHFIGCTVGLAAVIILFIAIRILRKHYRKKHPQR